MAHEPLRFVGAGWIDSRNLFTGTAVLQRRVSRVGRAGSHGRVLRPRRCHFAISLSKSVRPSCPSSPLQSRCSRVGLLVAAVIREGRRSKVEAQQMATAAFFTDVETCRLAARRRSIPPPNHFPTSSPVDNTGTSQALCGSLSGLRF